MKPIYFCTDIETSGQSYSTGSIVTLGCVPVMEHEGKWHTLEYLVENRKVMPGVASNFYIRMTRRPVPDHKGTMDWWSTQSAEAYEEAFTTYPRHAPCDAMNLFVSHIALVCAWFNQQEVPVSPVFVSGPISFDFDFVRNYLYEYCKWNPFGDPGRTLDPKSYMAGLTGCSVLDCTIEHFEEIFGKVEETYHSHHALDDAKHLAARMVKMLNYGSERSFGKDPILK